MTDALETIDPDETTVHEAVERVAGGGEVFRRFGLDTCCGGELPLATAAEHHGVDLDRLLGALERAAGGSAADGSAVAESDAGGSESGGEESAA